jgi:hypothetical protein
MTSYAQQDHATFSWWLISLAFLVCTKLNTAATRA